MNRFYKYILAGLIALSSNFALAAGSVDTAPTSVSEMVNYVTLVGTSMNGLSAAAIVIMGIIILVMGVISLGGVVAGVLKKIFG